MLQTGPLATSRSFLLLEANRDAREQHVRELATAHRTLHHACDAYTHVWIPSVADARQRYE